MTTEEQVQKFHTNDNMPLQYPDLGSDTTYWFDLNIIFCRNMTFATTHMNDYGMHPCKHFGPVLSRMCFKNYNVVMKCTEK